MLRLGRFELVAAVFLLAGAARGFAQKTDGGPQMSRSAPVRVAPVVKDLVRYEQNYSYPGYLFAVSDKTGDLLWLEQVYPQRTTAFLERDVQDVFFKSMALDAKGEAIAVVNESDQAFTVSIRGKERGTQWPAWVDAGEPAKDGKAAPIVTLTIFNPGKKSVRLDGVSVAEGGRLENDLFQVTVDGKPVPYSGMMKKRAAPSAFVVLKPGQRYEVKVDLRQAYAFPPGGRSATVSFGGFNHFSPDELTFVSNRLTLAL